MKNAYKIDDISIDLLRDNPYDQRKRSGDIESLAESIKERGLQNPISVIKIDDHFIIAHGHRRTHAYRYLKRKTIPAIIRKESTPEGLIIDHRKPSKKRSFAYRKGIYDRTTFLYYSECTKG